MLNNKHSTKHGIMSTRTQKEQCGLYCYISAITQSQQLYKKRSPSLGKVNLPDMLCWNIQVNSKFANAQISNPFCLES